MLPFLARLDGAQRVLIAGCGGGFDVYAGVPLAIHLLAAGKEVVFANLSFTNLWMCGGEHEPLVTWRIDRQAAELPYFPEKWLSEWLTKRGQAAPIYAFGKSGVQPLAKAYRVIVERHAIDLVLLVDGGTDSLLFGDEPGLGTVVEDAISLVAANEAVGDRAVLAAIGFGVDHFHGVSHHAFLENAARLMRDGGFLGVVGLAPGMPETTAFLDLVEYANERQPRHQSIVNNSIASAMRGAFGDHHATSRTSGTELFINPLMSQYWAFEAPRVVAAMTFAGALARTERMDEANALIAQVRAGLVIRDRRSLPL